MSSQSEVDRVQALPVTLMLFLLVLWVLVLYMSSEIRKTQRDLRHHNHDAGSVVVVQKR